MDLLDQGLHLLLATALVMMLAATLQSAIGFGYNLLAAPLLIYLLKDPATVVPALHLAYLPAGIALVLRDRAVVSTSRVLGWFIPALPGMFAGTWLLRCADATVMKRVVGAVTITSVVLIAAKGRRPVRPEAPWVAGAGLLSGLLGGSTGLSGPPIVLLGLNQGWSSRSFRADMLAYFWLLGVVCVGLYVWRGMLTATVWTHAAAGAPGMAVGYLVGTRLASRLTDRRFRYVAITLLVVVGVLPWLG